MGRGLDTPREQLFAAQIAATVHPGGARQSVSEEDTHVNEHVCAELRGRLLTGDSGADFGVSACPRCSRQSSACVYFSATLQLAARVRRGVKNAVLSLRSRTVRRERTKSRCLQAWHRKPKYQVPNDCKYKTYLHSSERVAIRVYTSIGQSVQIISAESCEGSLPRTFRVPATRRYWTRVASTQPARTASKLQRAARRYATYPRKAMEMRASGFGLCFDVESARMNRGCAPSSGAHRCVSTRWQGAGTTSCRGVPCEMIQISFILPARALHTYGRRDSDTDVSESVCASVRRGRAWTRSAP